MSVRTKVIEGLYITRDDGQVNLYKGGQTISFPLSESIPVLDELEKIAWGRCKVSSCEEKTRIARGTLCMPHINNKISSVYSCPEVLQLQETMDQIIKDMNRARNSARDSWNKEMGVTE